MSLDIYLKVSAGGSGEAVAFEANITHNLARMADEAGLYKCLWRPDELGIAQARELVLVLHDGLSLLRQAPERFEKLNPENGWGTYTGLVSVVDRYLTACQEFPDARVCVSR